MRHLGPLINKACSKVCPSSLQQGTTGAAVCDNLTFGPVQSGIDVNGFASTEYNVAVGGTDFGDSYFGTTANYWSSTNNANYESVLSYVPEIPWNDACVGSLVASYEGYPPYGANSFCTTAIGTILNYPSAGGGGPSDCATGTYVNSGSDGTCRGQKKPA